MKQPTERFPRAAYARRVATVADDMSEWVPGLLEFARGPNNWMHGDTAVNRAESRALAIQDIVLELQELAVRITAIR